MSDKLLDEATRLASDRNTFAAEEDVVRVLLALVERVREAEAERDEARDRSNEAWARLLELRDLAAGAELAAPFDRPPYWTSHVRAIVEREPS